jgi:nucleoside-diphosphate-sugar epimerase
VLIAGCGYVGSELARILVQRDDAEVFAIRRQVSSLAASVVPIASDLAIDSRLARRLPENLDTVVYTVAADEHTPEAYERAYERALERLLEALDEKRSPPARFLFVSSTAVYGQNGGETVDETSPTEPTEFSGQTLLRAETLARTFGAGSLVVRFGGIYGPGRTRFVDSVRNAKLKLAGGAEYTNRIHVSDCALALRHIARLESPAPVYNAVDDEPADRALVAAWMANALGVPPPLEPPSDAQARGKRCSNQRLRASGYTFRYPTFREGYADVIASQRDDTRP